MRVLEIYLPGSLLSTCTVVMICLLACLPAFPLACLPACLPACLLAGHRCAMVQPAEARCEAAEAGMLQMALGRLMGHEEAWPFAEPVSATDVPDYYTIIKVQRVCWQLRLSGSYVM